MPHNYAFKKLEKLWDHLNLPDEGPIEQINAKERFKSREVIFENAQNNKGMYEPTAQKWAYALFKHTRELKNSDARDALESTLTKHEENNTADVLIQFTHQKSFCGEIIENLLDFSEHSSGRMSNVNKSEAMTTAEYTWLHVFKDSFKIEDFDFLFGFRNLPKSNETTFPAAPIQTLQNNDGKNSKSRKSDLELIREQWSPTFESNFDTILKISGKYLLYRSHDVTVPDENENYDIDYGWFGTQKLRIIPVSIEEEQDCLKWYDIYPDPGIFLHISTGIVVESQDAKYDIYGIDKEGEHQLKFFGRFKQIRNGETTGAIFANDRYEFGGLEAYRFWLKRVSEEEYQKHLDHIKNLSKFFGTKESTVAQKNEKYKSDKVIFTSVADLLKHHERELVHYIFIPSGFDPDQLRSESLVKDITYDVVRKPMKTY